MKAPRWLTLAALALVGPLSAPVHAQWLPGGTLIASNLFGFGNPVVVAAPDGHAGGLVLARPSGAPGFELERVGPEGRFPAGWPSTTAEGTLLTPGLAADGSGGAYVCTRHSGPDSLQIVVHHVLADGSLDPAWPADGRVVGSAPQSPLTDLRLASDGSGGVYVAWGLEIPDSSQLFVQRLDAGGATSPGWPAGGVRVMRSIDIIHTGDVQASPAGLYVSGYLTTSYTDYEPHDTFIGHVTPSGVIADGWGTGTVAFPWLLDGSLPPTYALDMSGGLFYEWNNGTVGRLVHLLGDASPDPAWPVRGLALLADTTHDQFLGMPVSDGAGGFFARFSYDSVGTTTSLVPRLVHITANATPAPGWPLLGGRLPYVDYGYGEADIVPDGNGGAYATWFEQETGAPDFGYAVLRAHHVAAGGVTAPYWPATGLTLAQGTGARLTSRTVSDAHGGAIAFWQDAHTDPVSQSETIDLLALGFGPDGSLTTSVAGPRAATMSGLRVSPVPSRGPTSLAFALARTSSVRLDVLDLNGRRIRHLLDGTYAPGPHSLTWDGRDDAGRTVAPGVYLAHADGDGVVSSARLVRIR